jgi:4,5-dihydroxyphthalate decarboxylase
MTFADSFDAMIVRLRREGRLANQNFGFTRGLNVKAERRLQNIRPSEEFKDHRYLHHSAGLECLLRTSNSQGTTMTTLALDRYDRHFPFFDGTVTLPPGLALEVLQVGQEANLRDGKGRHRRMLTTGDFDAAETSLGSYVAAKGKGLPLTAIPVFPRRLFSQGQIYVNGDGGIQTPEDLAGRTIGLQSFQTTLAVLAKGDLAADYGVPLNSIKWRVHHLDTLATENARGFDITTLPEGSDLGTALAEGEIDALLFSRTPRAKSGSQEKIRRLFSDPRAAEEAYVNRHGYWPIMHIITLRNEVVNANPELPAQLMEAFADAKRIAAGYLSDPNWSQVMWAKYALDQERQSFNRSLWNSGVRANRANLECFLGYAFDQGLIDQPLSVDALFHPSVLDS